jgi:membrane protein DedA with SNARE-associated domain
VVAALLVVAVYLVLEGDLMENAIATKQWVVDLAARYGIAASFALLYIEESGIPLPVPGDVYVGYIGHSVAGSWPALIAAWLGIIAIVSAGASNLYLIARGWGPGLVRHRLAPAFHLDPARLATAERWFARWGILAVIFGRHIPGFRVPLTMIAGTVKFPYRIFLPAVAISTAAWSAFYLAVGFSFGAFISGFLATHPWVYAVGTGVLLAVIGYFAVRVAWLASSPVDDAATP